MSPNSEASGTVSPVLYVVAGERRYETAKKAGLTEVPAILVEGKHGEIALVERSFWGQISNLSPK